MNAVVQEVVQEIVARSWSPYQQTIFAFAEKDDRNAIIEAGAGSGKSTTLEELVKRLKGSTVILAFNRPIADALVARGLNARTFHSFVYSVVLRHKGAREVTKNKLRLLVDENLTERDAVLYGQFITKLVGLGRNAGIGCLVPETEQAWSDLAAYHDLELENEAASYGRALDLASKLLEASYRDERVDFDDLLYIAVRDGLALSKYDNVLVDEYQDTNPIQVAIIRKIMHAGVDEFGIESKSRFFGVGDTAQAIYGFRGADSNSMANGVEAFNAVRLPLTVSYRCPVKVVEFASQWGRIEAAPGAPDGAVTELGAKWDTNLFAANDLVVCRTNHPLVALAYQLLKARIPARISGKDIHEGLKHLIKKLNAKGVENLQERLTQWTNREIEKAVAVKNEAKAEAIQDKSDIIFFLIDSMKETARTVPALIDLIDELFADTKNAVVLASIHKAKGLEAGKVFWLNSSKCPAQWAKQEWQQQQERNLCYVAATRAKNELILIEEKEQRT